MAQFQAEIQDELALLGRLFMKTAAAKPSEQLQAKMALRVLDSEPEGKPANIAAPSKQPRRSKNKKT